MCKIIKLFISKYLKCTFHIDRIAFVFGRHSHLDDPGRTEWEGFPSGTMAAAAGTHIDCSLNLLKQ